MIDFENLIIYSNKEQKQTIKIMTDYDIEWPTQDEQRKKHLAMMKGIIERFVGCEQQEQATQPEPEPKSEPELYDVTRWCNRQICNDCWMVHNPSIPVTRVLKCQSEECIMCDKYTDSGIYVRVKIAWQVDFSQHVRYT